MRRSTFAAMAVFACLSVLAACGPAVQSPGTAEQTTPTESVLSITLGGVTRAFTRDELLARPDVETLVLHGDPTYSSEMRYRAAPLRAVLGSLRPDPADTLEIRATDGFVVQLPRAALDGAATPWIAIEDPAHPWPNLKGKSTSAGPFYLIWQNAAQGGISPEQWPYAMAALTAVASPAQRWPAIVVDAAPSHARARRGQAVFFANCMSCHRLGGAGEGVVGPDLLRPTPASAYFTDAGLRALIRNPAAVRTWPEQRMPAFGADVIPDSDVDAVVAYLRYLSARDTQEPR